MFRPLSPHGDRNRHPPAGREHSCFPHPDCAVRPRRGRRAGPDGGVDRVRRGRGHDRAVAPPRRDRGRHRPRRTRDRARTGHRAARDVCRADAALVDVAHRVARTGDRVRSARGVASVERDRDGMAGRGPRRIHDPGIRAERSRVAVGADARLRVALPRCVDGLGRLRPPARGRASVRHASPAGNSVARRGTSSISTRISPSH